MKAVYVPPAEATAGDGYAKFTLGEKPDETFVVREGDDPVEVPPEFEHAVRAHEHTKIV